jgi:beta-lactamase class A
MFNKKVPFHTTLVFFISTCVLGLLLYRQVETNNQLTEIQDQSETTAGVCRYKLSRLGGYKYIHPLMFAEPACESPALQGIRSQLEQLTGEYRSQGLINSAGIYLREFKSGSWISIGDEQKYSPGSLMKIPELITFYKMNEKHPGYLNTKVKYEVPLPSSKTTHFVSKSIEVGKTYTIRELLRYMVEYSDNNATNLLNQQLDVPTFKKVFTDLGLTEPDWNANDYPVTARELSSFMKVLYNASYLNNEDSEACLELMRNCEFKEGMKAAVPENCPIVHKFGEGGADASPDLSETGIIFSRGGTFMLTVMVNGRDIKKLPEVIRGISALAYQQMNGLTVSSM